MGGQKKETAEPKEGRNENRAGEEGLGKMMVDNLVDDIIDVPYSESLVMRKAGAWRKVLNQYESGAWEVEVNFLEFRLKEKEG